MVSGMLSPSIRQVLTRFRTELEATLGGRVRRVCLFGSWARGEADERSDVDVAAVIDGLTPSEWRWALTLASELECELGQPFSAFILSSERFELLRSQGGIGADIDREGISP